MAWGAKEHSHINSEDEKISIHRMDRGPFNGQFVLNIYDDQPSRGGSGIRAPMLLDYKTQQWLKKQLQMIDEDQSEGGGP